MRKREMADRRAAPPLSQHVYLALVFAAVNIAIGGIVAATKLPIYMDSIGLVISTILLGWRYGLVTAGVTIIFAGFLVNPFFPFYSATALGIVAAVEVLYRRGGFDSLLRSVLSGLVIAVIAAILSAPVTAYLGGNTMSGADAVTAFLLASGKSLIDAVMIAGFTAEPVDKAIVCALAYVTIRQLPRRLAESAHFRAVPVRGQDERP
jgi:energy-coupling factor transport system substrate-specific component